MFQMLFKASAVDLYPSESAWKKNIYEMIEARFSTALSTIQEWNVLKVRLATNYTINITSRFEGNVVASVFADEGECVG